MLESQKEFATYLRKMASLLNGQPFSYDQTLLEKVMETELVVPVVGAFSAGKSSLLNALMGKDILPVGIAPETELATELRYSSEPYLLAIKPDGEQERLPIDALGTINRRSSEFSHLRLYLNSEALKALAPLVLVDMPGFGSSLENHNKAIARVSEILCNRLMSDTVAENWRHHEQDAPHHYRRTAGSASGQLSEA
ncbi:dynamin family protein [Pseudomonas aeruginosa]|uniref:dynamin family protein n=1 Tax=Pseudomonas aeruginosa TaxID=287 RepID=UPI000A93F664|nr:dynamin family protein [Pseudomonas aeruginosa]